MLRSATALVVLGAAAISAFAETPQDAYWVELSWFYPTISSTARLDFPGTNLRGTLIQLEDELGLADRKSLPYLSMGMRLGERGRLQFEYYTLDRSATHTIGRDIDFGDITFPASVRVDSTFDTTIYRLTGNYSFIRSPQAEAGAALGLHVTEFKLALSGQGNGPLGVGLQSETRDTLVPLPTLGLYGGLMLSDTVMLRGRIDYLSLSWEHYDGSLTNWYAGLDWRFAGHWAIGAGYRYVDYKLDSTRTHFHGEANYKFRGPAVTVSAAF